MNNSIPQIPFLLASEWLPEALIIITSKGLIVDANRAARELLKHTPATKECGSLLSSVHGDTDIVCEYLRDGSRTRQPLPGAIMLANGNDGPRRYRTTVRVMQPATDTASALLLLVFLDPQSASTRFTQLTDQVTDVSAALHRLRVSEGQRIKLEAQMLQTQKLESLGVLAGGIAHDFNNLLTSVIGYADLARGELPNASSAREFIDEVMVAARHAAELTQQMLAYSGRGALNVGPVQLSSLVSDITRLLEVSISKKCVLRFDLMEDLPACLGDATQLRQVVMNLIINASDAIGDRTGVIAITTGAEWCDTAYLSENFVDDTLAEGLYVHLEVADTGSGMSAETRARIFDPFFTTKFTGRGLGLAAVLGIVRGHKGAIRVYSEPGRGTTFRMLLPAEARAPVAPAATPPDTALWQGNGSVLVIDDEESIRALARHMLVQMGLEVREASDGREGVAVFRGMANSNPLVLLDLTMPRVSGAEAFAQLRDIRPDVRVILMSGYSETSIATQFAGKGPLAFIQKPFRLSELRELVRKSMDASSAHDTRALGSGQQ